MQDTDFIQQIKKSVVVEEDAGKVIEEQSDGLDMDEGMLMAGVSMFERGFRRDTAEQGKRMFSGIFSFESALYMILYRKTLCEENTFGKR